MKSKPYVTFGFIALVVLCSAAKVRAENTGETAVAPQGQEVTLSDGTKILLDGTILRTDGTKLLPNGDVVLADGTILKAQ